MDMNGTIKNREKEGVITAAVGLTLNLLIGLGKLVVGLMTGSVSIVADGVNNLSDVGTSAVTVSSFALSAKKADREHPFGHGRFEYVASFIVSVIVLLVGAELAVSSIKIMIGEERNVVFSWTAIVVLIVAFSVKAFMATFYLIKNRRIKSDVLKAAVLDSMGDCLSTGFVALAFALDSVTTIPFDAIAGVVAAAIIIFGGIKLIVVTVNKLMGGGADEATEKQVCDVVKSYDGVLGVHDLMLHDYGADRRVASVDAEFDENMPFKEVHAIVDAIEKEAAKSLGISLVVHPDPVSNDECFLSVRHATMETLARYGREASFHELVVDAENKQVSLHLRLSKDLMRYKECITAELIENLTAKNKDFTVSVQYDFM